MAHEDSTEAMERLQMDRVACTTKMPSAVQTAVLEHNSHYSDLLAESQAQINRYADQYINATLSPLENDSSNLKKAAKGGLACESWCGDIPDDCSWPFMLTSATSLQSFEKPPFVTLIRKVSQAPDLHARKF